MASARCQLIDVCELGRNGDWNSQLHQQEKTQTSIDSSELQCSTRRVEESESSRPIIFLFLILMPYLWAYL